MVSSNRKSIVSRYTIHFATLEDGSIKEGTGRNATQHIVGMYGLERRRRDHICVTRCDGGSEKASRNEYTRKEESVI